jgi:hypothetical protein
MRDEYGVQEITTVENLRELDVWIKNKETAIKK